VIPKCHDTLIYTYDIHLFQLLANVSWRGVAQEQFWVRISQVFSSRRREKSQIYAYLHAHPPTWNNTLRIRLRLIPFLLGCVRFRAIGRDTRQFRNVISGVRTCTYVSFSHLSIVLYGRLPAFQSLWNHNDYLI